jgi:hypothetical protein
MIPLLGLFARKGNKNNWGTVFESKTKQPLANIEVAVYSPDGEKLDSVYTDKSGRYGFLLVPGKYILKIENQKFQINSVNGDSLYGKTYPGGIFQVEKEQAISFNIALNAQNLDWEEFVANKTRNYKFRNFAQKFLSVLYYFGFAWTAVATFFNPNWLNFIFLFLYVAFFIYDNFVKKDEFGVVKQVDGTPIPFAVVALNDKFTKERKHFAVSNGDGKYYLLANNGYYDLDISGRLLDGLSFKKDGKIAVKNGIVRNTYKI